MKIRNIIFIIIVIICFQNSMLAQIPPGRSCNSNYKAKPTKWSKLANEEKYQEAIKVLFIELKNDSLNDKHSIYWHIGQMYAMNDDYKNAIKYFKKSTQFYFWIFDREYYLYDKGTIAFVKRNKKKLGHCQKILQKKNSYYYRKNLLTIKSLNENFDKSYKEAYNLTPSK